MGLSYATPVDVWASGCIFAELFSRKPLLDGKYEKDQLAKIFELLGTPEPADWPENAAVLRSNFAEFRGKNLTDILPELDPLAEDLLEVNKTNTFLCKNGWIACYYLYFGAHL